MSSVSSQQPLCKFILLPSGYLWEEKKLRSKPYRNPEWSPYEGGLIVSLITFQQLLQSTLYNYVAGAMCNYCFILLWTSLHQWVREGVPDNWTPQDFYIHHQGLLLLWCHCSQHQNQHERQQLRVISPTRPNGVGPGPGATGCLWWEGPSCPTGQLLPASSWAAPSQQGADRHRLPTSMGAYNNNNNNNNNLIFILCKIHVNMIKCALHESKLSTLISYTK